MKTKITALLIICVYLISCQTIQTSSEKAFSNANSAIKDKVFIPKENEENTK